MSLLQSPHGWAIGSSRPTVQRLNVPVVAPLGDWIAYIGTRAVPPAAHFARAETVAVAATGEERGRGEEKREEKRGRGEEKRGRRGGKLGLRGKFDLFCIVFF